jgi:hypothetical protein
LNAVEIVSGERKIRGWKAKALNAGGRIGDGGIFW